MAKIKSHLLVVVQVSFTIYTIFNIIQVYFFYMVSIILTYDDPKIAPFERKVLVSQFGAFGD